MAQFTIQNAQVLFDGKFRKQSILITDGVISDISDSAFSDCKIIDASGLKLIPGFFDNHTHGCMGIDFNTANTDEILQAAAHYASWGVTGFLPAVMTDSREVICRQLSRCADAAETRGCSALRGIHLEGPFLSPLYKGAMPEQFLLAPDYDLFMRFQDAAHGLIKVVTISPELDGAVEFTRKVSDLGVRVSIGHSSASYEQAMACIDAGAASTTHTMNAMKLLHMHDPMLGVNKVKVENGDAKLVENGVRAGSTLTMQKALLNILSFTGLSLEQAVPMLSANAPRMLGLYETTGSIEKGKRADITLLDQNNTVVATFVCGKQVFGKPLV